MIIIPGYAITEIIDEKTFILCRAIRDIDKFKCILKLVWLNNSEQVRQLEHENQLTSNIDPSFILKPLSIEYTSESVFLTYGDFEGQLLSRLLNREQFDLRIFLRRALNISRAVSSIHNQEIIYKNLKPENIFINPKTDEVKVIDFGIASKLPSEYYKPFSDPRLIQGTLPYMSPEQTGRMNRTLDYRTDMYSLGVMFYQILTGKLPFLAKDAIEWVYCHLVLIPPAPVSLSPDIPEVVSDIVMKLMAKLPENRYQNIGGLLSDLEKCYDQLERFRRIESFELGKNDVSDKLNISQITYGREDEIQLLQNSFENVVKTGKPELVLISGYSGIGKTTLVRELYKPIVHKGGFFISGKFEKLKRDIPYYTIVEAFRTLITSILSEPEENLNTWKKKLAEALGNNGKIITDVIPQLEIVIGKQPPIPEVAPSESENRFNLVFEKFISVFAQKEHPLTFFADDLQWADTASLKFIRQIITNQNNHYILMLGAYRDNEVYFSHPLILALDEIKKTDVNVKEIILLPLKQKFLEKLIADSLRCELFMVKDLASTIFSKTGGNPFFTIQFLTMLYQDKLLRFDHHRGSWIWDIYAIEAREYTDNVAELMIGKISKLEPEAQRMLRLAACIGNKFDIKTLSVVSSREEDNVTENLLPSLKEGLVYSFDHSIKFLHDNVQQAAYSIIPEEEKKAVHLKIARLLFTSLDKEDLEKEIFTIATHFNRANINSLDEKEKLKLAEVNLWAARKAKSSFAYDSAITFSDAGMAFLSHKGWDDHQELIFALNILKAESEFLKSSFDLAKIIIDFLLSKTISKIQKASVLRLKIDIQVSMGKMSEAITISIECLKIFDISLSAHPSNEEVSAEFDKTIKNIGSRGAEEFLSLPLMADEEMKIAIEILARLYGPSYSTDANLYIIHVLMIINLSLKYGNAPASSNAYNLFGFILAFRFRKYRQGYTYGKMAVDLIEKHQFFSYKAKAYLTYSLIVFWNEPVDKAYEIAMKGFEAGRESGDLFYAGYCGYAAVSYFKLFKGDLLNESLKEVQIMSDFANKSKLKLVEMSLLFNEQFIRKLQDINFNYFELNGKILNENKFEEEIHKYGNLIASVYHVRNLKSEFIYQNREAALYSASELHKLLWVNKGTIREFEYYYFYSLSICANYEFLSPSDQSNYLSVLKENLEIIGLWSENCPENFKDKYILIYAEFCRITGKTEEAAGLYEEAIASARINGFINNEALALELTSIFYRKRNFEFIANSYLKEARDRYFQWGANGKVQQLEGQFPSIKNHKPAVIAETIGNFTIEQLDLSSIIKSFQIISEEIILEKLIKSLMRIVVEQAGAEKGTLLLNREGELVVVCNTIVINNKINICIFEEIKIPTSDLLPLHLTHYVKRTQEKVVIEDVSRSNLFSQDTYFLTNKVRSVACLPIIKQGKLLGILYLENNLFSNAFSLDKISTLELLSSQAAISIENALLYNTAELHKKQFEDMMNNSSAIIFAKKLDGRYLFVNLQFEKAFNVSRQKITGLTDNEIFSKEFANQFSKNDHLVLQNGHPITYEESAPQKDGIHFYIVVKFPLVNTDGKQYAVCGIATDITDKKRAEEAILKTNKELVKTTRDLDDFIYASSHHLKQPIVNLEGLINTIQDPDFNDEYERNRILEMLKLSVEQSKRIIKTLESLSHIQRYKAEDIQDLNFATLTDTIVADNFPDFKANIKTYFTACEKIHFSLQNLSTIIINLLSNAIKFRHPERTLEITLKSEQENGFVLLTVRDNGLGIPLGKIPDIFSMFKRMHAHEGTGVGLYIIKRILDNTGGKIEVESEPGKGSAFKVYLKEYE